MNPFKNSNKNNTKSSVITALLPEGPSYPHCAIYLTHSPAECGHRLPAEHWACLTPHNLVRGRYDPILQMKRLSAQGQPVGKEWLLTVRQEGCSLACEYTK